MNAVSRLLLWCILVLLPLGSHAASIESLLMPGPLIKGHAKYEEKCESCHESFSKTSQRQLCMDCHKDVAADIAQKRGFHGRKAADPGIECKKCHTDHKGRDADIVLLVPENFDHSATDFVLHGHHENVRCTACHTAGKKYREAPKECVSCHRKQDVHKGNLGDKCGECHKSTDWRRGATFDHGKTKFALHYKHEEASCDACHPDGHYKNTPRNCIACHQVNDVHGGRLGKDCAKCHTDKSWKKIDFDHDTQTKFPLRASHRGLACNSCHKSPDNKDKPPKQCNGCHVADDVHKGRNGAACEECHSEKKWSDTKFDHAKASGYRLKGAHAKLECQQCHKGPVHEVALERACKTCHVNDDAHRGKLGTACERCHNEYGWNKDVVFDHDVTRFPLIGLHATAPCEACHVTTTYRDTKSGCNDCHAKDDKHKGTLGKACGRCHNPNGWGLWQFDHNHDTKFVLDGAHKGLACSACHRSTDGPQQSSSCISCHSRDDAHQGSFGQQCDRCHVTSKWDDLHRLEKSMGITNTKSR